MEKGTKKTVLQSFERSDPEVAELVKNPVRPCLGKLNIQDQQLEPQTNFFITPIHRRRKRISDRFPSDGVPDFAK